MDRLGWIPSLRFAAWVQAPFRSRSILDPNDGAWRGSHTARLHTVIALTVLAMQALSAGVPLSFVTVAPSIPRDGATGWVVPSLDALDDLVTKTLRPLGRKSAGSAWGRFVGTLTVAMGGAAEDAWAARPHLHLVLPTVLVPLIEEEWAELSAERGLPRGPLDRPAVHAQPLGGSVRDIVARGLYLMRASWVLPTVSAAQPLAAVARQASRAAARGDRSGWVALGRWAATVTAIRAAMRRRPALKLGLVTSRRLRDDARDVARILDLESRTAVAEMEHVAGEVLALQPHLRHADDLPLAIQRLRAARGKAAMQRRLKNQRKARCVREVQRSVERACAAVRTPTEVQWLDEPRRCGGLTIVQTFLLVPQCHERVHPVMTSVGLPYV